MYTINKDGGAHARPAILSPTAHSLASLNESLLRIAQGHYHGQRLPRDVAGYAMSQQFVAHRRPAHGDQAA